MKDRGSFILQNYVKNEYIETVTKENKGSLKTVANKI